MGSRRCTDCDHLFFAHGPDGCACGCMAVIGGLWRTGSRSAEDLLAILRRGLDDPPTSIESDGVPGV